METSLYEEVEPDKTQEMKKNMFLDFGSGNTKQQKFASLLASPDLNMLKLASPELEKMLLAQNSLMANTPTPTQFVYPKFVTDEQEAYARGFVEALAQLHGGVPTQAPPGLPGPSGLQDPKASMSDESVPTYSTLMPMSTAPVSTFSVSSAASTLASMSAMNAVSASQRKYQFIPSSLAVPTKLPTSTTTPLTMPTFSMSLNVDVKDEPSGSSLTDHTVPTSSQVSPAPSSRVTDSPALSPSSLSMDNNDNLPIDMEDQEKIKVERKRARNRIAARKCRTRKLERISRLEDKVNDLKSKNHELAQHASSLNEQVIQLKQQIMDHMKTGCQIMMPNVHNL